MSKFLALLSIIGLVSAPAMAAIEKGNSELGLSLSLSSQKTTADFMGSTSTSTSKTTNLLVTYGYFITPKSQIQAMLSLAGTSTETEDDPNPPNNPTSGFFYLGYNYHFIGSNPKSVPYIGVLYGKGFYLGWDKKAAGNMDAPSLSLMGAQAGLKYFVSEKTAIGPLVRFTSVSETIDLGPLGEADSSGTGLDWMLVLTTLF